MTLGGVLVILSIVIRVSSSADPETTVSQPTTTTTESPVTTITTTLNYTDPETPTTTTTEGSTTTTISAVEQVAQFISRFAEELVSGDSDFVNSRLHPEIVSGFGAEACAAWVASQIMALSDYRLTGDIVGPTIGTLSTPTGSLEFPDRYSAQVSFMFGGQDFESTADFVILDGIVYFTGTCQ